MFEFSEKQTEAVRNAIATALGDQGIELNELRSDGLSLLGVIDGAKGLQSFRLETKLKLGAIESTSPPANPEEFRDSDRPKDDEP